MILEERTEIAARPEEVFEFFAGMDEERYRAWHPDHITYRIVEGQGLTEGTVVYFEERRGGKELKLEVVYRQFKPNRYIEFAPTSFLYRLLLPSMSFEILPWSDNSVLIARVNVRAGPIGQRLNREEFDAIRQHMKEEGDNLKQMLEESEPPSPAHAEPRPVQATSKRE